LSLLSYPERRMTRLWIAMQVIIVICVIASLIIAAIKL
jgi:hypothetical protein